MIAIRQFGSNEIGQWPGSEETNSCTDQDSKIEEADGLTGEIIRRRCERLALRQIKRKERAGRP